MSALDRLLRRPWVAALLTGVWMLVATIPSGDPLVWVAIAVSMIGVVVSVHHATVGAAVVCVGSLLCTLGGAPYGELEILLPTFWVLFWWGREHSK